MAKNWDQARWAQHRRTPAKRPMLAREVGPLPGVNLIADTDTHACEACGYHVCGCSIDYDWQRKKLGIIAGGSAAHEAMEYLRRKSEAVMAAPECVSEPGDRSQDLPDGWEEVRMGKAFLQRERGWLVAQSPRGWLRTFGCVGENYIDPGMRLAASGRVTAAPAYDTARDAMEAADAPR